MLVRRAWRGGGCGAVPWHGPSDESASFGFGCEAAAAKRGDDEDRGEAEDSDTQNGFGNGIDPALDAGEDPFQALADRDLEPRTAGHLGGTGQPEHGSAHHRERDGDAQVDGVGGQDSARDPDA